MLDTGPARRANITGATEGARASLRRTAMSLSRLALRTSGFTVIELVTVIVILGVLAAIAGPRFFGTNVFTVRGYADEIAAGLRYAQKVAVASGCAVSFSAAPSSGYTLTQRAAAGNSCASSGAFSLPVPRPDGSEAYGGTPPSGADLSASGTFTFDASGAALASGSNVLQVVGESATFSVSVDTATGLVVVEKVP